jgi:hypothetical protein
MTIFLQAPGPEIAFGTAPSGSTYISDANGLVIVTNGSAGDALYLLGAGCVALSPGGFGQNSLETGTSYTVQLSDNAQETSVPARAPSRSTCRRRCPWDFACTPRRVAPAR